MFASSQYKGYPWTRHAELAALGYAAAADTGKLSSGSMAPRALLGSYAARRYRADTYRRGVKNHRFMRKTGQLRSGQYRKVGSYGRYTGPAPEKKFMDFTQGATATVTAGVIYPDFCLIGQGVKEDERIGRKCCIYNMNLHFNATIPTTQDPLKPNCIFRLIYFIDHQTNGVVAGVTDILKTANWLSYRNLSQQERFTILKEKWVSMTATGVGDGTTTDVFATERIIKFGIKNKIIMEFGGSTGAITEIKSNSIGLLVIGSTAFGKYDFVSRVRFGDCLT